MLCFHLCDIIKVKVESAVTTLEKVPKKFPYYLDKEIFPPTFFYILITFVAEKTYVDISDFSVSNTFGISVVS